MNPELTKKVSGSRNEWRRKEQEKVQTTRYQEPDRGFAVHSNNRSGGFICLGNNLVGVAPPPPPGSFGGGREVEKHDQEAFRPFFRGIVLQATYAHEGHDSFGTWS